MNSARLIYITTPTKDLAQKIATTLLEEKLIACANILPEMNSIYSWEGQVCSENEVVLILKTTESCISKIKERVPTLHSAECPCLLVLPVADGHGAFLQWLSSQTEP